MRYPAAFAMALMRDLRVLRHLLLSPIRGRNQAERLESFYARQAEDYDAFRRKLLHGREELWRLLPPVERGVWVDLGCGTGSSLEFAGPAASSFAKIYLIDLSESLLAVARKRIDRLQLSNVETVHADVTSLDLPPASVDLVTFSYSLTMIPDWFAAVDHARSLLRPGGHIGVVDFYVSRKYPAESFARHGWWTRSFWPCWFAHDNVFLNPDHVPYLHRRFRPVAFCERRGKVPYLPGCRVPFYIFVGCVPGGELPSTPAH